MTGSGRSGEAHSFGGVAASYDRYRPSPPREAVAWMLPDTCRRVVDLGAGTGAVSRRLAERVGQIVAVEPDPRMLSVLVARSPGVAAVRSYAERLPVADRVADAVVASSAWHWMETEVTVAEVARVLRPGGVLGMLWNGPDRSVGWVGEVLGPRDPSPVELPAPGSRHHVELPPGAPFGQLETRFFTWQRELTPDELVGIAGTYSSMITLSEDERSTELERIRGVLATHPELRDRERLAVPMGSRCWRAVRR